MRRGAQGQARLALEKPQTLQNGSALPASRDRRPRAAGACTSSVALQGRSNPAQAKGLGKRGTFDPEPCKGGIRIVPIHVSRPFRAGGLK
jgi:hypothetical protein